MKHTRKWTCRLALAATLAVLAVTVGRAEAGGGIRIKQNLAATGVDPDASGQVQMKIDKPNTGMRARLDVKVRRLDRNASYEVVLDGVRIGTLTTTGGGNGRARFSSQPRRRDQLLGVDPRGMSAEIHNAAGDHVLETTMPDDTLDPTKSRCCLPHHGDDEENEQPECEDRTPDECTAAGGVDLGAGSCLPNPCEAGTPPPAEAHVVCCTPEDHEPECEKRSPASCSEHHGINLGAGSCEPNPCISTTPTEPETVRCCLAEHDEVECEHRTPEQCAAQGGTDMGPGACEPDACGAPPPPPEGENIRCCMPHDGHENEPPECEQRTAAQCTEHHGTNLGAGACEPNPCG